ncbi:zinc-binding dehydrogenase [Pseudomonas endophytica]
MVDRGLIKPHIDGHYDFTAAGVSAAHARLESGRAVGKVIIERQNG